MLDTDELLEQILMNAPQSWESSEGSAESIAIEYVRALENRLIEARGPAYLEQHVPEIGFRGPAFDEPI